ncbi:hypothetical protein M9H77_18272 [Catharanthus roseus]|uniref:Uncharacterized protein n=1 Tax=Catharanthus roseus TaxID=4058 RepID=A0ACC0B6Z5_CATRO|nr:hypothetical protein M9H77_18272 [Catharanthus roseus]
MGSGDEQLGLFSNLPSPITYDILSRLPSKSIFGCKSVCKSFLKVVSEPEFLLLYQSRSPFQLLINTTSSTTPGVDNSFNLVKIEDEPNHHRLHYLPETKMKFPKVGPDHSFTTMIGSINGLVCLVEIHFNTVHIWNPTTREYITIEIPKVKKGYPNVTSYGFGLSSTKGQFHVIMIFQEIETDNSVMNTSTRIIKSKCHVYTLGTGSWRSIGHASFLYNCREKGIFLNGNIHWLIHDQEGSESISCLDLETELFKPFPSPKFSKQNLATLNTYGGYLCVCDNTCDFNIIMWTMKEYGVKNSWTREAVISKYPIDLIGCYYEVVHVVKVFKDGEILLIWRDDWFLSYHLEKKTLISFDARDLIGENLEGLPPCVEPMDYVSTILSLRSFQKEIVKVI